MTRYGLLLAWLVPVAAFASPQLLTPPPPPATRDLGPVVARLVDDTTKDPASQARAFRTLMGMGQAAVPYVVAHLGDGRKLAEQSIWVQGVTGRVDVQYHPWYVHDGLLAVLKEITGFSRASLNGHALPSQRERNTRKWVSYCEERYPAKASVCQEALANIP
ncbi:hypothetical protein KPL74_10350 [Bacillus sp. NP157]|nr:hypothetical protein KPL74_10350 [Bacillus sp. NP157]